MVSSELRAQARKSLQGKWGKAALLTLCYVLIMWVISFLLGLIPIVGPIASAVISIPISFGLLSSFIKLRRDEEVSYTDFLSSGFASFGKAWGVFGNMLLKMIIPIVLIVICVILIAVGMGGSLGSLVATTYSSTHSYYGAAAGFGGVAILGFIGYFIAIIYAIVKGYLYSLSYYILYDNPDKSGKEIVEMSESMMRGNRWRYFWLGLTFIGWVFLSAFTLYIGMLWVMPYIMVTFVCFYEDLAGKNAEPKAEENNPIQE